MMHLFGNMPQGCLSPNQNIFSSQQWDLSQSQPKCLAVSGGLAGIQIKLLNLDRSAKGILLTKLFHLSAKIKWKLEMRKKSIHWNIIQNLADILSRKNEFEINNGKTSD